MSEEKSTSYSFDDLQVWKEFAKVALQELCREPRANGWSGQEKIKDVCETIASFADDLTDEYIERKRESKEGPYR